MAYAFLLYRRDRLLREVAEKRLAAIREFTDLGLQHARFHEVALAVGEAFHYLVECALHVDEHHALAAQLVAVDLLQRRAGNHGGLAGTEA